MDNDDTKLRMLLNPRVGAAFWLWSAQYMKGQKGDKSVPSTTASRYCPLIAHVTASKWKAPHTIKPEIMGAVFDLPDRKHTKRFVTAVRTEYVKFFNQSVRKQIVAILGQ